MGTSRILSLGLGLALATLGAVAAPQAKAQQLVQIAQVESVGGYVAYSDKTTIWAEVRGSYTTGGYIHVERRLGRGGGAGTPIYMTGKLAGRETYDMWNAIYSAQPWRTPRVRARHVNTDFPDTIVTYAGRYRQEIRASYASTGAIPAGMPMISTHMERFLSLRSAAVQRIASEPFFVLEGAGGMNGFRSQIMINRDGSVQIDTSTIMPQSSTSKQGRLTPDELAELNRLCASYASYPASFAGNPTFYDGIGQTTSLYRWGVKKSVFAGEPQSRPADYQRIIDKVEAFAAAVP